MKNKLTIIIDEIKDGDKLLEKEAVFNIETSDELSNDFIAMLNKSQFKTYRIKFEQI